MGTMRTSAKVRLADGQVMVGEVAARGRARRRGGKSKEEQPAASATDMLLSEKLAAALWRGEAKAKRGEKGENEGGSVDVRGRLRAFGGAPRAVEDEMAEDLVTLAAACRQLGVGYYRSWRRVDAGAVLAVRAEGRWLVRLEDLRRALAVDRRFRRKAPADSIPAATDIT